MDLHAGEIMLNDLYSKISHLLHRVGVSHRLGVLQHYHAAFVVFISDSNCGTRQSIKKLFLRFDIIIERLVIIQMIMGDVRKYPSGKWYSGDSLLVYGMGANFHKAVTATGISHLCE